MLRRFTDTSGTEWRVWQVSPTSVGVHRGAETLERLSLQGTPFADGWLCFESDVEKRRLAPIPPGWEDAGLGQLLQLRDEAGVVPSRELRRSPAR